MTHLYIELNTGLTEEVDNKVIEKLYNTVTNNTLDETSDLKGRLHVIVGYKYLINYLNTTYPDLHISADEYAIPFEDPNMLQYLVNLGIGSNGYITEAQAAAATTVANSLNTTITKFNELKYFTNITESKGGFDSALSGKISFYNWTALLEVDISNLTCIGHSGGYAYEDTFYNCKSLKTVTASDKLTKIGYSAFNSCTNLEHITGLSGTILVSNSAFFNCSKLPDEDIAEVEFEPAYYGNSLMGGSAFSGTKFTEISLSANTTVIPDKMFMGCTNLRTVNGLGSNITLYGGQCFQGCTNFTGPIDFTNVKRILGSAFLNSGLTGAVNLQHIQTINVGTNFSNTNITSVNYYDNVVNWSGQFSGCTNLTTVSGASNILSFATLAFKDCTSLTSIDINWNNTLDRTVQSGMFYNCTSLTSIDLSGVTTINNSAFSGCTNLQTISNISSVSEIDYGCFWNCKSLTSLDLSGLDFTKEKTQHGFASGNSLKLFGHCENLTTIGINTIPIDVLGNGAFINCKKLSGSLLFPNLTTLDTASYGCLFRDCLQLTKLSFGHITTWGMPTNANESRGIATGCTNLKILDLGDSITTIYTHNCLNCTNLAAVLINTSTVPSYGGTDSDKSAQLIWRLFGNSNVNIYVPDAAVNDYKAASGWSNFASHILPISLYNESAILAS